MDDKENQNEFEDVNLNEIASEELKELNNNPKEVIYHELNHEDDEDPDTTYNELTNMKGNFFRKWFNRFKRHLKENEEKSRRDRKIRNELIRDGVIKIEDDNDKNF